MLTPRQSSILAYIKESIAVRGYPPTVREIGAKMGIASPNGVCCHLNALEKKGLLRRSGGKSRALEIVGGISGTAANTSFVAAEDAPQWMVRPSRPGLWVCEAAPGSPGFSTKDENMNALVLSAEDLSRGAPFRTSRVYGPIPRN